MISIALATYNGAEWIREQIKSIQNQTIQDFELVICDDCSTDNTWSILNDIKKEDTRIRIYQNTSNIGFKKNFEKVISLCDGEMIALSDQDDIWFPCHLEILQKAMTPNTQVVCARPLFVDEQNNELPSKFDYLRMYSPPKANINSARHILLGTNCYQGASMLVRKNFFEQALPIPDGVRFHDTWFAILSCFIGGFVYVDEPIMRYRRLTNSVTYNMRHDSAFRMFIGITIHKYTAFDRLYIIEAIKERVKKLTPIQQKLLVDVEKILKRRNTLCGRLTNLPYLLRHFKSIYACDIWHIFS